jgi:hypothetical protein
MMQENGEVDKNGCLKLAISLALPKLVLYLSIIKTEQLVDESYLGV